MVQIATTPSTSGPAPVADMEPLPSVPGETPPSDAIRKERFASELDRSGDHNSGGLAAPLSPNSLLAGSGIAAHLIRSEDRSVGKGGFSKCRSRGSPIH